VKQEHSRTAWCYGREIAINAACAVSMFLLAGVLAWGDPAWLAARSWISVRVSVGHAAATFAAGLVWLHCAIYMWNARQRQLRREDALPASLDGDLTRALEHVNFQIDIARSIVWRGLLPALIAATVGIAVLFNLKDAPPSAYVVMIFAMIGAFACAVACQHFAIKRRYYPRRAELENLRAKLADPR
jgi:hypothetical protein